MGQGQQPAQGRIALVACGKRKRPGTHPAASLYIGPVFTKSLAVARAQGFSHIFILSALHGLVPPEALLEAYDHTLYSMSREDRLAWGKRVAVSLQKLFPGDLPPITFFAGSLYRDSVPLPGESAFPPHYGLGKLIQWLSIEEKKRTPKGIKKCGLLF